MFYCASLLLQVFFKILMPLKSEKVFKGGKSACPEAILAEKNFSSNFIFFHPFESINFQPAGFLAFKEKSGPLLHPY